jgi:hypothetical protein
MADSGRVEKTNPWQERSLHQNGCGNMPAFKSPSFNIIHIEAITDAFGKHPARRVLAVHGDAEARYRM